MNYLTCVACLLFHAYRPITWSAFPLCPDSIRWWYSWSIALSCRDRLAEASTPRRWQIAKHSSCFELSFASFRTGAAALNYWKWIKHVYKPLNGHTLIVHALKYVLNFGAIIASLASCLNEAKLFMRNTTHDLACWLCCMHFNIYS